MALSWHRYSMGRDANGLGRLKHISNQFSGDEGRSARDKMIDSKDRAKVPSN